MPKPTRQPPSQPDRQQLKVRIRSEIFAAYGAAVALARTTKQDPIEKFCEQYARDHGIKIPRPPRRTKADTPKGP